MTKGSFVNQIQYLNTKHCEPTAGLCHKSDEQFQCCQYPQFWISKNIQLKHYTRTKPFLGRISRVASFKCVETTHICHFDDLSLFHVNMLSPDKGFSQYDHRYVTRFFLSIFHLILKLFTRTTGGRFVHFELHLSRMSTMYSYRQKSITTLIKDNNKK